MKKQMKWLLAALAIAALATPAFAVTADMTGTLGVRGIATNNYDGNDNAQDHTSGMDQRFRLFTSVAANENVKAVLGLEVDNVLGRTTKADSGKAYNNLNPLPGDTTYPKDAGAVGADDATKLEIKHLYLDFKIPALGANVKAGTQPFNFGRGLIINDDAAGFLITMPCKVNPDNKLELTWIKTSEGQAGNTTDSAKTTKNELYTDANNDEGDFYGAKYSMKVAGIGLAPYVGIYKNDQKSLSDFNNGVEATFAGVDVDGKAGDLGYALTAIYNTWSNGGNDGSSVTLFGKGTYAAGDTTFSLEAASMGDKDNQGGNAMSLAQNAATGPIVNISEILTGGMYAATSKVTANVNGGDNLYLTNWLYAKVGVAQKLSPSMKVSAYVAHIAQAEDTTTDAKTYGQEVDAYFDYNIVPGLDLNVMGAYLLADDDFGSDNAYKLGTSLNYKF